VIVLSMHVKRSEDGGVPNPIEGASRRLGVSTFTTRRLVKARQLLAVRIGKRVLIPKCKVERVIREGCGPYASAQWTR
jgi:excisionase family DNA binding protein